MARLAPTVLGGVINEYQRATCATPSTRSSTQVRLSRHLEAVHVSYGSFGADLRLLGRTQQKGTMVTALIRSAVGRLRTDFCGQLILPGDERYDAARAVWNGAIDRRPALSARATGTDDVITACASPASTACRSASAAAGTPRLGWPWRTTR